MWAWPCTIYFSLPMCNAKRKKTTKKKKTNEICARGIFVHHQCINVQSHYVLYELLTQLHVRARASLWVCVCVITNIATAQASNGLNGTRDASTEIICQGENQYTTLFRAVPMIECVHLISLCFGLLANALTQSFPPHIFCVATTL